MKSITRIDPVTTGVGTKKRRVAAYCRVSTVINDQLLSLEVQKAHYEEYIAGNPEWEFAGIYYDEGISGTKKEKRPALMKMISDCEDGKIDYILTKSLSRFARNTVDCLELVRKLLGMGIPIYFEKENIDTGSMGSELILTIMGSLAEGESVSFSENIRLGVRYRFENGAYKAGYAPYGYTVTDGEYSINEGEAEWVRFIFAETLSGTSAYMVAKDLNEKKVPARKGDHWSATTIRGIIKNEKYVGDCLLQKTYSDFRFQRHINHGQRDQFLMEDHHEAIISREDFEAAGRMLLQHRKGECARDGGLYPFTGRVFCGECGTSFMRRRNSDGQPVWVCQRHIKDRKGCQMMSVQEAALESAFCTVMNKLVFARKEVLQDLQDDILRKNRNTGLLKIDEIDTALETNTRRRQELTAIMSRGYIDPATYTKETNSLLSEAANLEEERDRLIKGITGDRKGMEALRGLLKFTGQHGTLSGFHKDVFSRFVDRVTIYGRDEAVFHLKCDLDLRERIG